MPAPANNHNIPSDPRPLIGEPLPLDLLNTRWQDGEGAHDLLETLDGLAIWLSSAGFADQAAANPATRYALLTTRDALHSLVSSGADQETARSDLNETLAHGSIRRSLGVDGPASRVEIVSSTWMPAWAAAETYLRLLEEAPERISACRRRGCVLHFYDLSHDRTRRWCSVTGCGSRTLKRVAGLVARGASPDETFGVVAEELGCLFEADCATVQRYEPDGTATVVGEWCERETGRITPPADGHRRKDDTTLNATILRTGRPARVAVARDMAADEIDSWFRENRIQYAVGCPVIIEGCTWGSMNIYYVDTEPAPTTTEKHLAEFADEIGLALTESRNREELLASQARVVSIGDETRRDIERNLHDSVQQRLISLGLEVAELKSIVPIANETLQKRLTQIIDGLAGVGEELREISRGLHPPLSRQGLVPALGQLARWSKVPAELDLGPCRRLPERVEVAIYYVVSEALTNAAKHARASSISVALNMDTDAARLSIRDDGVGGAGFSSGSGLTGLRTRVESLGGKIHVVSPAGEGTSMRVELPISGGDAPPRGEG